MFLKQELILNKIANSCFHGLTSFEEGVNIYSMYEWSEKITKAIQELLVANGMSFPDKFFIEIEDMEDQYILRFSPHLIVICRLFGNNEVYSCARSV